MSAPLAVLEDDLGSMERLGKGALGESLLLPEFTHAAAPRHPVVYRRLNARMALAPSALGLRALVGRRRELDPRQVCAIDNYFNWPWAVVVGPDEQLTGFLESHWDTSSRSVADVVAASTAVGVFGHALNLSGGAGKRTAKVPMPVRLTACAQLARAVALLHRAGVVYGDLWPGNLFVQLEPEISVWFPWFQTARLVGWPGTVTGGPWGDHGCAAPEEQASGPGSPLGRVHTLATDRYRLAASVVHLLGEAPSDLSAVSRLVGPTLAGLLEISLNGDPAGRPGAVDLCRALLDEIEAPGIW